MPSWTVWCVQPENAPGGLHVWERSVGRCLSIVGNLFSEWRASWDDDDGSDAYRAKRSLRLARTARDFQAALTSLSNYKQKSWYTHMLVWVVWQQVWL